MSSFRQPSDAGALGLTPAEWSPGTGAPRATRYDDVYFSAEDGLAESEHVFINGNDLPARWRAWSSKRAFVIIELGSGTGRNIIQAWRCFEAFAAIDARLHIVSIEKHPLRPADLASIWADHPEHAVEADRLVAIWPALVRGVHRRRLTSRITLDFVFDDIQQALADIDARADAWFVDGFAPTRNPRMWQQSVFDAMIEISRPGATFATYSCAGAVRRGLTAAGFDCVKRPGFGRKRDMLVGRWREEVAGPTRVSSQRARRPWFIAPPPRHGARIAVVGAGIAGASAAEALTRRGYPIDVYDPRGIAGGASGNEQAALYIRPGVEADARTRFYLTALDYTLAWLAEIDPDGTLASRSGVLQLAIHAREADHQRRCLAQLGLPESIVRMIDSSAVSAYAGTQVADTIHGALFYPYSGWLRPAALCRRLLHRAGIRLYDRAVCRLVSGNDEWRVVTTADETTYDHVILACGAHASELSADLAPLTRVRGQVSVFDLSAAEQRLAPECVVCARGYAIPPDAGRMSIGASFVPEASDTTPRDAEHRDNLVMLGDMLPDLAQALADRRATARAAWRCVGYDRMPYVGPVPDTATWQSDYAALARDASQVNAIPGAHQSGLWASLAHGSHGLLSAPLAAEILASHIADDPLPVGVEMADALHPGRWLIRQIIRQQC